jgi:hypothetical protein
VLITEPGIALLKQISKTQKQDLVLCLTEEEAETLSDLLDRARG